MSGEAERFSAVRRMSDQIIPYIRHDDYSWWAGCRFAEVSRWDAPYIREVPCFTRRGARWKAKRLAVTARSLRDRGLADFRQDVGDPL